LGDTGAGTSFDPSLQWIGFARDTFDGLGAHEVLSVPEPRSWLLLVCGTVLVAAAVRRARGRPAG
jgi:hypothetical protein